MLRKKPSPKTVTRKLKPKKGFRKLPTSDVFFKQLKFLIFLFVLSIFYIFNMHNVNSKRIAIQKMQDEIKYLRGEHTALKAQNVDLFRHSVLLEEVKKIDLNYSDEPLKIISYDKRKL